MQKRALIFGCQKECMILALVINFVGVNTCHPKHITLGLFEVVDNPKKTLAKNLIELLE
jgi:hypothetical protein